MSIENIEETKETKRQPQITGIQQQTNYKLTKDMIKSPEIKGFLDNFCTNEEIKKELSKEIYKYPLICKLLNKELSEEEKKDLLQEALQKQQEANEHIDKDKLNKIAETMKEQVKEITEGNPKVRNLLRGRDIDTTTFEEKKEIFQTIIQKFSEAFGIKPPKFYTDGINIPGLGTSSFIKIDTDGINIGNIGQLMHEYTHYLQTNGKTSNPKYIKQSRDYYVLPMYDGDLLKLTNEIYDNSLMEQEAEYTRKVAQKLIFNESKN